MIRSVLCSGFIKKRFVCVTVLAEVNKQWKHFMAFTVQDIKRDAV